METISLTPYDWVKPLSNNLLRVFNTRTQATIYNLKYYHIEPSNNTQKTVIDRIKPHKPDSLKVDYELKQLTTMELLRKKLNTYDNNTEKLKTEYDKDNKILLKRRIKKAKDTIIKNYNQLKKDTNFKIKCVGDNAYKMVYSGEFVNATKTGNLLNPVGVF